VDVKAPTEMRIVLDGNDGTGKSTLSAKLKEMGFKHVADRGIPTKMTDDLALRPGPEHEGEVYVVLDAPVPVCRARLAAAGKDMNEKYHTVQDLTFYRDQYMRVAGTLGVFLIDSSGTPETTLARVMFFLGETWMQRQRRLA
jgi:thymidylate kinase